jgi:hypothetical protein
MGYKINHFEIGSSVFLVSSQLVVLGLEFDRQAFYHLSHTPALFALVIVLTGPCVFAQNQPWSAIPLPLSPA